MHTVNHAAVGAGLALILPPAAALPLAFLSHFVLDALPHYGVQGDEGYAALFKHKRTNLMVLVDIVGFIILLLIVAGSPWYVYVAMALAVAPDLAWPYRYYFFEKRGKKPGNGLVINFHKSIQWCERSWGIFIEIPFAAVALYGVSKLV